MRLTHLFDEDGLDELALRRPLAADRRRDLVDRFFNQLKSYCGIAVCYHGLHGVHLHMTYLASIRIMTRSTNLALVSPDDLRG